jgi:hypothetical protein
MNYGWQGKGKGVRVLEPKPRPKPVDVSLQEAGKHEGLFVCTVCNQRKVKAAHLLANHFRFAHKELNVKKDSWKQYVAEV